LNNVDKFSELADFSNEKTKTKTKISRIFLLSVAVTISTLIALSMHFDAITIFSSSISQFLPQYGNQNDQAASSYDRHFFSLAFAVTLSPKSIPFTAPSSSATTTISSYSTTSADPSSTSISKLPPRISMIYNGKKYDNLYPFIFYDGRNLNKIKLPILPDTAGTALALKEGSKISFQFDKNPKEVDAFVIDYDADINSVTPLKKIGVNTFDVSGLSGIKNLEVHAVFSKDKTSDGGQYAASSNIKPSRSSAGESDSLYASYSTLVDIKAKGSSNAKSLSLSSSPASSCNTPGSNAVVDVSGIKASHSGTTNNPNYDDHFLNNNNDTGESVNSIPANVLDNKMDTAWSAKGKGTWILLDLGSHVSTTKKKSEAALASAVCNIEMSFDNADKVVNFFMIQTSTDGIHFSAPIFYQNTGLVSGKEWFGASLNDQASKARYVKITLLGNTQGDSYSVAEIKVLGKK
jgi:hypothetical protein